MTKEAALKEWQTWHDELVEVYRVERSDRAKGYDRPETKERIDLAEAKEHAAWLAYRELDV